ncbi:MAG: ABC transporter ATP-binding protein [Firmicutes bacterium]|nr:ABC transporter ATP-binding protein [Dethiobacter sp.]MBS3888222.1 ABC transporter ATP-binding protein [Bacillota bacterium]MBS4053194.1 ABC transporter ATP-binding protein [Thermaerobacter sp.]
MRLLSRLGYLRYAFKRVQLLFLLAGITVFLGGLIALLPPYLTKLMFDRGVATGDEGSIVLYGLLAAGAYLLGSALRIVDTVLSSTAGSHFILHLKRQAMERLLQMQLEFFDKHQSGSLVKQLDQVSQLGGLISPGLFTFVSGLIQGVGALLLILRISVEVAVIALPFMVAFFFLAKKVALHLEETTGQLMELGAHAQGSVQETISGIAEIKQSTAENRKAEESTKWFSGIADQEIRQSLGVGVGIGAVEFLAYLLTVIVTILSGIFIVREQLTVGDYMALVAYIGQLTLPALSFSSLLMVTRPAIAAFKRLAPLFDGPTEREFGGNKAVSALTGDISFTDVTFAYESGKEPVLQSCSFNIAPGECVALLGKNGAGKSTAVKLMLGFYSQYQGGIFFDGTELREYNLTSLRQRVGIVSQSVAIFTGSLWDNVKMARPSASKEEVERVLDISGCTELFKGLAGDRQITEGGKNLSGGQRQAIAIARCLLKDPDVLIFDEATTHLDAHSCQIVIQAFKYVFSRKTRIIITHDEEVAKIADAFLLLEGGTITRHEHLPSSSG